MIIYLASNSPRRKQLLSLAGWSFTPVTVEVDESPLDGEFPQEYVQRLANNKARQGMVQLTSGVVIAADTTVAMTIKNQSTILGKPTSVQDAERMLRQLRGIMHQVYTALAVFSIHDQVLLTDCCCTDVQMRNYQDDEMHQYIASGDPLDKAGAYAIQHAGFRPVESIKNCYANVMGLPLCHLTRILSKTGIEQNKDIPQACQAEFGIDCLVFQQILSWDQASLL